MNDWITKEDETHISFTKPGYELDCFEICWYSDDWFSVKVPLKQADCIYTTAFTDFDEALQFVQYHMSIYG